MNKGNIPTVEILGEPAKANLGELTPTELSWAIFAHSCNSLIDVN